MNEIVPFIPIFSALVSGIAGALIGGMVTGRLQKERYQNDMNLLRAEHKTEFMAETTARYFLSHQGYTDRSFDTLRDAIGGFGDDELRQILVRAGALRTFRKDGSEWWRLLSRNDEFIEKVRRIE